MEILYKNYADAVKSALAQGKKRGDKSSLIKGYSNFDGLGSSSSINESADINLFNSLKPLSDITGKKTKYHERPGSHPDFGHIKEDVTENHYITSMFIDIKNSTGLFKKYAPEAVANITTIIQKAALHTCWYFDGYVQRFHGDGLFVYFGGKNMTYGQSITNALNAASFFSYFVQNDLKNMFAEQEVEKIYTRIGIDTGFESDVVWHLAGVKDCSEITTCSLHTSLAAKMQANAKSNGIIVGDNVKDNSSLITDLYSIKYDKRNDKEERYIFQIPEDNFNYTQWEFNWEKYLRKHPNIIADEQGNLFFKNQTSTPLVKPSLNTDFLKTQVNGYKPYFK